METRITPAGVVLLVALGPWLGVVGMVLMAAVLA